MSATKRVKKAVKRRVTRRRRRSRNPIVQEHHIWYSPEWTVKLFKGEHWVITQLNRRRRVSQGFIVALKDFLERTEEFAVDLGEGKTPAHPSNMD